MNNIVGILLAAGASRRFGADKLDHCLANGVPVAVQACRNLMAGADEVVAVLRPGNKILAARLRAEGAEIVICADADQGMGHSLACGVNVRPTAAGWLIALADMPWITPSTIRRIADALRCGAEIAAPSWQGRRGHPVGFAGSLKTELMDLNGDAGAKAVIQAHRRRLQTVECNDPGVIQDIDTPADLPASLQAAPIA